jgi:hypothetical protein
LEVERERLGGGEGDRVSAFLLVTVLALDRGAAFAAATFSVEEAGLTDPERVLRGSGMREERGG